MVVGFLFSTSAYVETCAKIDNADVIDTALACPAITDALLFAVCPTSTPIASFQGWLPNRAGP